MVDLVKMENVSVHVAAPRERVPANRTRVRFRLPHYRYLCMLLCYYLSTAYLVWAMKHSWVFKPYLTNNSPEELRYLIWITATFPPHLRGHKRKIPT